MGFGKDDKGAIIRETQTITLGTIADSAAVKSAALAITDDFRILRSDVTAHVLGLTADEGAGLLLLLANEDLDNAQIAGCLTTDGPLFRNDRDRAETAERWVRVIAKTRVKAGNDDYTQAHFYAQQGSLLIEVKPRWTFSKGTGWAWAVFNNAPALTTGAVVRIQATHYGVWL